MIGVRKKNNINRGKFLQGLFTKIINTSTKSRKHFVYLKIVVVGDGFLFHADFVPVQHVFDHFVVNDLVRVIFVLTIFPFVLENRIFSLMRN